jgi:stress response protein YsnF
MADPITPLAEPTAAARAERLEDVVVVPVLEESVRIGKEVVRAGAVRVRIVVEHGHAHVGDDFAAHEVQHRVQPVGEPARERREPYRDGDELVIPVYEERPVVELRLFLKEEVRLRRVTRVERREAAIPVRRERAVLERQQPDGSWREGPIGAGAPLAEPLSPSPAVGDDERRPTHSPISGARDDEPDPGRRIRQP